MNKTKDKIETYRLKSMVLSVAALTLMLGFAVPFASADIQISPWFPQEMNYVFYCNNGVENPTSYDWNFGDGQKLIDMEFNNIYHTFEAPGTYEVACTASNEVDTQVSLLEIITGATQDVPPVIIVTNTTDNQTNETNETTTTTSTSLNIAPWFPQGEFGQHFVFECNAEGFNATSYDWDFGDGQLMHDVANSNVWHTYMTGGSYAVECTATNSEMSSIGEIHINVGGIVEQPTDLLNATVAIAQWYPQGLDYVFTCDTSAFNETSYTWDFGDGEKLIDVTNSDVWHTFGSEGNYTVICDTKDTTGTQLAKGTLDVNAIAPIMILVPVET